MQTIIKHIKEFWPLWGIVVAVATALTTYIGLPKRVESVEQGQETLEQTFQGYLHSQQEALAEQRGYQKALNEQMQQQTSTQAVPPTRRTRGLREWDDDTQTMWRCPLDDRDRCFEESLWEREE